MTIEIAGKENVSPFKSNLHPGFSFDPLWLGQEPPDTEEERKAEQEAFRNGGWAKELNSSDPEITCKPHGEFDRECPRELMYAMEQVDKLAKEVIAKGNTYKDDAYQDDRYQARFVCIPEFKKETTPKEDPPKKTTPENSNRRKGTFFALDGRPGKGIYSHAEMGANAPVCTAGTVTFNRITGLIEEAGNRSHYHSSFGSLKPFLVEAGESGKLDATVTLNKHGPSRDGSSFKASVTVTSEELLKALKPPSQQTTTSFFCDADSSSSLEKPHTVTSSSMSLYKDLSIPARPSKGRVADRTSGRHVPLSNRRFSFHGSGIDQASEEGSKELAQVGRAPSALSFFGDSALAELSTVHLSSVTPPKNEKTSLDTFASPSKRRRINSIFGIGDDSAKVARAETAPSMFR